MNKNPEAQDESAFFYGNLVESMDGELSPGDNAKFQSLLNQPSYKDIPARYTQQKGSLQLMMQNFTLNQRQRLALQAKAQNREAVASVEAEKIHEVESTLARSNFKRSLSLIILIFGLGFVAYKIFAPTPQKTFKPLDALSYEAIAMDSDSSNERLALPTSSPNELDAFFLQAPGISFTPLTFRKLPENWLVQGASVIDYEIAKITVAQYQNQQTKIKVFIFALSGKLEDLPKSEEVTQGSLNLRPYASDRMNLLVWQHSPSTLAVLAGRSSIKDLLALSASVETPK